MLEVNKIYNMDCFEMLKQMDNNSVDLIVIDPPYNIRKDTWDKIKDYEGFMEILARECRRVLKDKGSLYIFCDSKKIPLTQTPFNKKLKLVNVIVWRKNNHKSKINWRKYRMYSPSTETILFFVNKPFKISEINHIHSNNNNFSELKSYLRNEKIKSGLTNKDFNLKFSEYTNKEGCRERSIVEHYFANKDWRFPTKEIYEEVLQKTGFFKIPYKILKYNYEKESQKYYQDLDYFHPEEDYGDVWDFNIISNREKLPHLTQKPIKIIKRIIQTSTKKRDLVLDCFMGSGTTALACKELGRDFIGCDSSKKYVDLANERLQQEVLPI